MLADFVTGLALMALGGFIIILALPSRRRRRLARERNIRELRRRIRYAVTVVEFGAGLLTGVVGLIVTLVSLAGFQANLI
jgi:uncharacterized membrane protein YfcA